MTSRRVWQFALFVCLVSSARLVLPAGQGAPVSPALFADMRWRNIGPYRGGRTKSGAGVASQPYTFYIGVCNGGVWKTTNAGRTWKPVFDDQPTGSIGWVTVAPSDPNVVYVASGEGLPRPDLSTGDGIYKSTDAGKTWVHLGLRDGQQIPKIVVDPRNPNRLFVAVLGHPYGANEERGVFRSVDGGLTFQKVLYRDENTGAKDVDIDPVNPDIVYATLWESRQGPWENGVWSGTGGIFKSTDGGTTWTQLAGGLPDIANAEMTIAPSNPRRLFALIDAAAPPGGRGAGVIVAAPGGGRGGRGGRGAGGAADEPALNPRVYRSDDAGATWARVTTDQRVANRVNESVPIVDPKDPDTIIVTDVVTYKSVDGGKTWVPFKGAPGGDDYQNLWINPNDTHIMLLVSDQGAVVTLDGGDSWGSWYNQPTAALYHVTADNAFPYRVCGGQQDSGSVCISSRGNDGHVTVREWHPIGVEEYGYAAPDPLDPDVIYGGKITRHDRRTGQTSQVGPSISSPAIAGGPLPPNTAFRTVRTLPVVFSLADPHTLFFGNNFLWKTIDGGVHWTRVSPDLTRKTHDVPPSIGKYSTQAQAQVDSSPARVIYAIGPSYVDVKRIWIGTDDGVIATTADAGVHWTDVTPPKVGSYWKVFTVDPGRFDPLTAYAAVNTLRLDDMNPHLFRTHDGGKTWTEIVNGLPGGAAVSVIREDPKKKGLLFAGSETQVYVSFDDGDHWQSLRLNMPASSIRDLVIKDDDLVVGTHGRGIWILDDVTPLRQIDASAGDRAVVLYAPTTALRVRWNTNTDTPWPPDEPAGANPPEGAILNYFLKSSASGPVTLEILEAGGRAVRRYSSADPVVPVPDPSVAPLPAYWYRPPQHLSAEAGMHRFTWDVHYQPLEAGGGGRGGGLPISAVPFNTVPPPTAPWVSPGAYTVKLTVDGKSYTQPLTVRQDPRVKTSPIAMQQIYTLSRAAYFGAVDAQQAEADLSALRAQIAQLTPRATGAAADSLAAFDKQAAALAGAAGGAGGGGRGGRGGRGGAAGAPVSPDTETLATIATSLGSQMNLLQAADVTPQASSVQTMTRSQADAAAVMARWTRLRTIDLPALNLQLKAAGLPAIVIPAS